MNFQYTTASPEVLCLAVRDLTGIALNAVRPEELSAAKVLATKLLEDHEQSLKLAHSIALYTHPAPQTSSFIDQQFRNVQLQTIEFPVAENDPLDRDEPSAPVPVASHVDWLSDDNSDAWCPVIDKRYLFISPESLGFRAVSEEPYWSKNISAQWQAFLLDTEKVFEKKHGPDADHSSWLPLLSWKKSDSILSCSTSVRAKNYSVVELNTRKRHWAAHFLFDAITLYVLVIQDQDKESKFDVRISDTENLARHLYDAFGRDAEYAHVALKATATALPAQTGALGGAGESPHRS